LPASEALLRPTRRDTVTYVDGSRVDVDAEGVHPAKKWLKFVVTVSVHCEAAAGRRATGIP